MEAGAGGHVARLHVNQAVSDVQTVWCLQVLVPMIAYVAAPASGAHFNPIVTFAFMATGILVSGYGFEAYLSWSLCDDVQPSCARLVPNQVPN